jgi:hypothetical protein
MEKVTDSFQAREREKFLKSGAGRMWLKENIESSAAPLGG